MKKLISFILTAVMLISMIQTTSFAENPPILSEGFDYDIATEIGTKATDTMPWYKAVSDLTNFTPEVMAEGSNKFLALKIDPGDTSANHQRLRMKFSQTGVEGNVVFSFKVRLPKNVSSGESTVYENGTNDINILESGKSTYMNSFRVNRTANGVYIGHIPRTNESTEDAYTETIVEIGTFNTTGWITVTSVMNTKTMKYTCSATDGTTTISDGKEYMFRNNRGTEAYADYTGLPMYADILLTRNQQNIRFDLDDVTIKHYDGVRNARYEPFNYDINTVVGTKVTEAMPWYRDIGNASTATAYTKYSAYIGGDSTNTYLVQKSEPDSDTTSTAYANHKRVFTNFGETEGIINYSYKIYIPTSVASSETTNYNENILHYQSLIDSGNREVITVGANHKSSNAVTINHIKADDTGKDTAETVGTKFKTDTWITVTAQIDTSEKKYSLTVTDGTTTVTTDKANLRQFTNATFTGKPAGLRYYINRKLPNTLIYIDDVNVDVKNFAYAMGEDIAAVTVPEEAVEGFKLPTTGSIWGSSIAWSSDNAVLAVDANGNATITPQNEDVTATLTATYKKGTETKDVTYTVVVKNKKYVSEQTLRLIVDRLEFEDISGQKAYYLEKDFTPVIPDCPDGFSVSYASDNTALVIEDGQAKLTEVENDTTLNFTVTITDTNGNSLSKVFNVLVPGNGIKAYYEGFDNEALKDKLVSELDNWTIAKVSTDVATTGTTSYIRNTDGDGFLDTQRYRSYSDNQYAVYSQSLPLSDESVFQSRMKFTGDEKYWYIMYFTGVFEAEDGTQSTGALAQLSFDTYHAANGSATFKSGINGPIVGNTFASLYEGELPFNEWFNFRMALHSDDTYDLYINDKKLTTTPITAYRSDLGKLKYISRIQIGASRDFEFAGNFYVDDIMMRNLGSDEEFVKTAAEALTIAEKQVMFDMTLPTKGDCGTTISWASSPNYIAADGTVSRPYGLGTEPVTLTATISRNDYSLTKDFDLEVVRMPKYEVQTMTFTDALGNVGYTPAKGGKISSISIKENSAVSGAKLFVAVYEGTQLSSVKVLAPTSGTQTLDIALPSVDSTVKAFIWNNSIIPLSYVYKVSTSALAGESFTIHMMGDSIMAYAKKDENSDLKVTQTGWGEVIGQMFDDSAVSVVNHASGGRSTRSFIAEGRLQTALEEIEAGDYMIIKFGHNDQKPEEPEKYTTLGADGTYRKYLQMYVDAARSKGAIPVLATSIYRRRYETDENGYVKNEDGTYVAVDTQSGYPEDMIEYAKTDNVPLLDLHTKTGEWLAQIGPDASASYYMSHVPDNTHLTYYGALELNRMAKEEMERIGLPLVNYFTK